MWKLNGIQVSNYYNSVKLALLEKGIPFEEVEEMPRQEEAFFVKSPMGKVPALEVEGRFLTESSVIYDFIEDTHPEPALYPRDPFARAKAKEILHYVELYIDQPARRHFPHVFFKAPRDEAAVDQARPVLEGGLRALRQLAAFDPFLAGTTYTYADIAALFHFGLSANVVKAVYDWDIVADVPGLQECFDAVSARPAAKQVLGDLQKAMAALSAS